jgi:hypothetical protein
VNDCYCDAELRRIEEISQNASRPERGVMVDGWSVGLSPSKAKRSRGEITLSRSKATLRVSTIALRGRTRA